MMRPSERFYEFIEELEGRHKFVYLDTGGEPTIGVGHLLTKDERKSGKIWLDGKRVRYADGLSDPQINWLLRKDTRAAVNAVNNLVRNPLTQGQFDALVSFTFNVGTSAFKDSTLLKKINSGRLEEVPTQLRRWKYDNGKEITGLVNRREKEIELWLS